MDAKLKTRLNDAMIVSLVVVMSVAANLPEDMDVGLDRRYLLAGLVAIVVVSLIKYLKFALILVVAVLAVGANLPGALAQDLGVDKGIMMFALGAMVIISLANQIFKLPTGLGKDDETTTSQKLHGAAALFGAVGKGRVSTVQALLQQGVSANVKTKGGQTPLMYAAAKGYADICQLLIARGADVSAKDSNQYSALKIAKAKNFSRVVDILASAGAKD